MLPSKFESGFRKHVKSFCFDISAIVTIPGGRVKKPIHAAKLWIELTRTSKAPATISVPGK